MSYRGSWGKSNRLSVTTDRDGSRSFDDDNRRGGRSRFNSRGRRRGGYRGRGGGPGFRDGPDPRSRLVDDEGDVSMSDSSAGPSTGRYNPYGSRPQSRRYGNHDDRLAMDRSGRTRASQRLGPRDSRSRGNNRKKGRDYYQESTWYKVTIPYGAKVDKTELLALIASESEVPFQPIQYHLQNKAVVFFVNGKTAADSVGRVHKKFTLPGSEFQVQIIVRPSGLPPVSFDEPTIEKLKVTMSERYDVSTKALNLSAFSKDQKLVSEGIHLNLPKHSVMNQVINIIEENIPELTSLDASLNNISSLDSLSNLVAKTPHLTHLNLSKNKLRSAEELSKISKWKLVEIILDGNPLCDHYEDRSSYISAVRKHFPKVLKLDGHELPPPIMFDLELSTDLPQAKENYFKNDAVRDLVVKFVKQYYDIFDSGNREGLVAAYHDEAQFSLSFGHNRMIAGKQNNWPDMYDTSRNLIKLKDTGKRKSMVKRGKLEITSFLCSRQMPKTTHDRNSFHVDISIATNELLMFSVLGLFKEDGHDRTIRSFRRVFCTVSGYQGAGMVIVNDLLTITNAGPNQVKGAFKTPAPTPSSSPVLGVAPVQNPLDTEATKLAMVQQFSIQSGMNIEFSTKCLEENDWNFEKAGGIFTQLQKEGKIPPEAFIK